MLDGYSLHGSMKPVKVVTVKFVYLSGRACLDFAGTVKRRDSEREELLTEPKLLSDWAIQAGLVDAAIDVTDDDLATTIALREAIYRTVTARIEGRRPTLADVNLLNECASRPNSRRDCSEPGRFAATAPRCTCLPPWPRTYSTWLPEPISRTSSVAPTRAARACTSIRRGPGTGSGVG